MVTMTTVTPADQIHAEEKTLTILPAQGSPKDREPFTCTFCWHRSTTAPQVIGSSARIACQSCYAALINLAICWVCSEVVFRGDECVSLGWCFWHRACYGCLLCGSRMVARGVRVEELFDDQGLDTGKGGLAVGGMAREVDEIPLCAQCYVEVEAGKVDEKGDGEEDVVVGKALRRMEYHDGGLGRRRWDVVHGNGGEKAVPTEDGAVYEPVRSRLGTSGCTAPLDSTIYVSIHDPINEPSFRPSPTKPIPTWMQPFRPKTPEDPDTQQYALPNDHLLFSASPALTGRSLSRPPTPVSHQATPRNLTPRPVSTPPFALEAAGVPRHMRYSRAGIISTEPLKRPSSRLGRVTTASSQNTAHSSNPEHAPVLSPNASQGTPTDTDDALQQAQQVHSPPITPHPAAPLTTTLRKTSRPKHDSPFFSARVRSRSKSPAFIKARMAFEKDTQSQSRILTPPPMSSEYIERYQPVRPPSKVASSSIPSMSSTSRNPTRTRKAAPIMATVSRARPSVDLTNEPVLSGSEDRPGSPEPVNVQSLVQGLHVIQGGGGTPAAPKKRSGYGIGRLFGR